MPYKDIGAFRRAYRSEKGSFAHERCHHLIRDQKDYAEVRRVLSGSENLPKSLAEFQDLRYNDKEKYYAVLLNKAIQEGRQPIQVEADKQGKHFIGHNNYIEGRSYFAQGTTVEQIQKAVKKYAGTGSIEMGKKNGKPSNKEVVHIPELTGFYVDQFDGKIYQTHTFKIHYAKHGVHVVPKRGDR